MNIHRHCCILVAAVFSLGAILPCISLGQAPPPVEPVPNAKQLEWYHRELMAFFHFNMNTFTGDEWGDGTASPSLFNPTSLDCEQWIRTIKGAGFTCAILTAKHHDGFCLWPSAYTTYDIASSPYKGGNGDVIKEFTDACRKYGVKPALYLSPWDRHEPSYGTAAYNTFYTNQLRELLTGYGTIWEIWWDGAGDQMAFDFRRWADTVKALQPDCFIFGAKKASPYVDGRWIGNEDGIAGDPCWATIDRSIIDAENLTVLPTGQVSGGAFVPAECDVSIRPGWYFHGAENSQVKSVSTLWNQLYFGSVGRNCVFLLNLPPDTRGLVYRTDSIRIDSLGGWVRGTFATNLAAGATVTALHTRGPTYGPENMVDTSEATWYAAADAFTTDTLTFALGESKTFDCAMVQEAVELGHRITRWSIDYSRNGSTWTALPGASNKQSIGYKWLVKFNQMSATHVRLRITAGKACPVIHTFGLFRSAFMRDPVVRTEFFPERLVSQNGSIRIAGATLLLPDDFTNKKVRVEAYDLRGRHIKTILGRGVRINLQTNKAMLNNQVMIFKCSYGGGTARGGKIVNISLKNGF
ncbi:MAG: alpha-L-fucosidase [Chitinispirillaceae bacterium]|nr:alpha-L-fucosidase [Chitinispirillaceae bacterium]